MENNHQTDNDGRVKAEENYDAHQRNPAPSPEAINERDDKPAGNLLRWVIVIAVALLVLIYVLFIL